MAVQHASPVMVFTIGSALVDIFIHSSEFNLQQHDDQVWLCQVMGEKKEVESLEMTTGGAGSNVAVGIQRLGFQCAAIAELGKDDFAQVVVRDLEKEKVNTEFLIAERREQTGGAVILVASNGERTVLVHRGAAAQLDPADLPVKQLARAHWIHLSSVAGREPTLKAVFALARQHSINLSWNPGHAELELLRDQGVSKLGISCQVLIMNKEEWQLLEHHRAQLVAAVEEIVITNGREGGWWYHHGQLAGEYQAAEVTSVDDTGAGDAFCSAYVAARLSELPPQVAVQWGVHNAASVVQAVGAKRGLLSRAQLARMSTRAS